ncbi:MAG: hypothetical protein R3F20_10335 [Planctomycetota bacterium]
MIFRFMEKYRVPILIVVLVGLAGFGVWAFIVESIGGGRSQVDPGEVYVTVERPGGDEVEITREQYFSRLPGGGQLTPQERAGLAVSAVLRERLAEDSGIEVDGDELKRFIKESIGAQIEAANGGKFDEKAYAEFLATRMNMAPERFESTVASDLRLVKYFRELQRVNTINPVQKVVDTAQDLFKRYKLKGVFFDTLTFDERAKLARGENDQLTAEAETRLSDWWKDLTDDEKRRYNRDGAEVTAEVVGFSFKGMDDEALKAAFEKASPVNDSRSLQELTADFTPSDDDKAKLKLRLDRHRDAYGVDAETPLDEAYAAKAERLEIEWKILRLVKSVDIDVKQKVANGEEVDLPAVARANNLTYFKYSTLGLNKLAAEDQSEFPGSWVGGLRGTTPGSFMNLAPAIGPMADNFFVGPADVPGKHASVWRLNEIDLRPIPSLVNAKQPAIEAFEKTEAERLCDDAIAAFEKTMDDFLEAKVADFAKPIRDEAAKKIAERTAGLDPEADKEKIETITKEENDAADALVGVEKDKYVSEAFAHALEQPGDGVVVEEGYFLPMEAMGEKLVDQKTASLEEKARSYLRRGFQTLQDDPQSDRLVEAGAVSDFVDARGYVGVKGRAMLVDKRKPGVEEIMLHPTWVAVAERTIQQKGMQRSRAGVAKSMWDWDALQRSDVFKIEAPLLDKDIAERVKENEERDRALKERARQREEEEKARRAAEAGAAN